MMPKEGKDDNEDGEDTEDCENLLVEVLECPTVATTLKNLGALYRRQGKYEAAETLEDCALRARKEALEQRHGRSIPYLDFSTHKDKRQSGSGKSGSRRGSRESLDSVNYDGQPQDEGG
ncbi:hypothetical protein HPB51_027270 [Rhipicephalus microplus]|uniref:Kinesin light chain n=1 Tax=Rhipicephalus microplus TaxID=6941 RepID=A0A9J6D0N8_RHIMP|nr:hypothetical protein HPB51_027270 [Rhipicephalus microplus]